MTIILTRRGMKTGPFTCGRAAGHINFNIKQYETAKQENH